MATYFRSPIFLYGTMSKGKLLLRGGILVGEGNKRRGDVLICDGVITAIAEHIEPSEDVQCIDVEGRVVTYGLADVHVHLREPGFSAKERIATGSMAAACGGFTTVCTMPNLNPVPDSVDTIAVEQAMIDRDAVIEVLPYAAITLGRAGDEIVNIEELKDRAVGFSDDGSGVQNDAVMLEAMRCIAAVDGIIAAHCEDNTLLHGGYIHDGEYARSHSHRGICSESEWGQIVRDIELVKESGCRYHVCHISARESVEAIRRAKQAGLSVTCETAPHYLALCDADLQEDGRFKMNPPLRSADDKAALIEGIKDGTIEIIATDHAPHTAAEKSLGLERSAMGIVGLETSFGVVYTTLVRQGVITLEKMIELMCDNPRRIFRLGGALRVGERADIAVFDVEHPYCVDSNQFKTMGRSTPFEGWQLYGSCIMTIHNGDIVWQK